jgi:predicted lactoylglutathione lyase
MVDKEINAHVTAVSKKNKRHHCVCFTSSNSIIVILCNKLSFGKSSKEYINRSKKQKQMIIIWGEKSGNYMVIPFS